MCVCAYIGTCFAPGFGLCFRWYGSPPGSISPTPTHAQGSVANLLAVHLDGHGWGATWFVRQPRWVNPVIDADTLPRNRHIRRGHVSGTILLAAVSSKLGGRANAMDLELPSDVDSDFAPRSPSPPSLSPPVKKRVLKRPAAKKTAAKPAKKVVVSNMIDMVTTHLGTPEMPADLRAKLVEVKVNEPCHDFAEVFSPPRLTMVVRDYNMVVAILHAVYDTEFICIGGGGVIFGNVV